MLGLNQYENASVFVSPNPVKNVLNISAKDNISSVQLFDIQGRLLQTKLENNTVSFIDLSEKSSGIYFVKVFTDKGLKVQKIIKE
jgi:PIN domain nuclease of toxin-antitoxin system